MRDTWRPKDPIVRLAEIPGAPWRLDAEHRRGHGPAKSSAAARRRVGRRAGDAGRRRVAESLSTRLRRDAAALRGAARRQSRRAADGGDVHRRSRSAPPLDFEMARDERVMVLGEDVGGSGGVFRATDGLQARFGKDRVVDAPLVGERDHRIGGRPGDRRHGAHRRNPILGFTHNAFNQIVEQLARLRYRSWGTMSAPVVIRAPFGGGVRAPEMHSDALRGAFRARTRPQDRCAVDPADARGLLMASIRDPDPVLFLEPLRGYRLIRGEVPRATSRSRSAGAHIAREGKDVTVIAWSAAVEVAKQAADEAAAAGIAVEVIDLRTLVPLDEDTLRASVRKTGRCVILQEASQTGGFAAEIIATIQEHSRTRSSRSRRQSHASAGPTRLTRSRCSKKAISLTATACWPPSDAYRRKLIHGCRRVSPARHR